MPPTYDHDHEEEVMPFASTNFRGAEQKFGIKTDDRRRHIYLIGKTGMGKTTVLENMVLHDINVGHGVAYIDPHGDAADKFLDFIPPSRINDIVYFNPSDLDFPIGFNILEINHESEKHLVASGMMGVFKKIWEGVWSPRMEYILLNCILALLDVPGSTMMGISRILADKEYRKKVVEQVKDPVVRSFWVNEFAGYSDRFASEAIAPVQNKVGQFLSAGITRNIVAQTKSTFNLREIMDERKILIANLSKGKIGEDSSRLLGGMLITRIQLAAMERVDIPEKDRQDFYLYVDEFQNFATESFANILSEARKYRLNLVTAHQYIGQLESGGDTSVRDAIFGNVGTIISFRVGAGDAEALAKEFAPTFIEEDIINLSKYEIYLKLMIDGVASTPFSAKTLPPIAKFMGSRKNVVNVSRERYTVKREAVEEKVNRWSEYMTAKPKGDKSDGKSKYGAGGDFRTKKPPRSEGGDFRTKALSRSEGGDFRKKVQTQLPPPSKDGTFGGKIRITKSEPEEKKIELPAEPSKRDKPVEQEQARKKESAQDQPTTTKPPLMRSFPKREMGEVKKTHAPAGERKVVKEEIVKKPAEAAKPNPPLLKPLPKFETKATRGSHHKNKNKKKRPSMSSPPPSGDGSFTGRVRIVEEDKGPSVVLKDNKPKTPPPPEPQKFRQEPNIQVPPDIDDGPKKLDPGETVSFE